MGEDGGEEGAAADVVEAEDEAEGQDGYRAQGPLIEVVENPHQERNAQGHGQAMAAQAPEQEAEQEDFLVGPVDQGKEDDGGQGYGGPGHEFVYGLGGAADKGHDGQPGGIQTDAVEPDAQGDAGRGGGRVQAGHGIAAPVQDEQGDAGAEHFHGEGGQHGAVGKIAALETGGHRLAGGQDEPAKAEDHDPGGFGRRGGGSGVVQDKLPPMGPGPAGDERDRGQAMPGRAGMPDGWRGL